MSEALAKREPPHDFPAIEDAGPKQINVRMAMTGIYALQGLGSMYRCAVKAGFSRSTARRLTANGITVDRCIAEAAKLDPNVAPTKLLEGGRRVLAEQIAFRDPAKMQTRDAVKLFEATEKYFGGHELTPSNALLTVADRLSNIVAMLTVARERGLPVPSIPSFTDAEIVEAKVSVDAASVENSSVSQHKDRASDIDNYDYSAERVEMSTLRRSGDCIV
jgi:hypothetical protein